MVYPLDRTQPKRHGFCTILLFRFGVTGRGCKVGVIDTGLDVDWLREYCANLEYATIHTHDLTPGREGSADVTEKHHGSRVVRDVLLFAPQAEIHSLRVYGRESSPSREELVAAVEWCARNEVAVANISTSFYGQECTYERPCVLCRAINTYALSADVFSVVVGADAYTLSEQAARGDAPALCPALSSLLAWAVEGPEVVADRAKVLASSLESGSGLSFTTAKFSGGAALLRSVLPRTDVFSTHLAIRETCLPLRNPPAPHLGFGRHCFLLAYLYSEGVRGRLVKATPPLQAAALRAPSNGKKGDFDAALCEMLQWVVVTPIREQRWADAAQVLDEIAGAIEPWASKSDLALLEHVRGSCFEALGLDDRAAPSYDSATKILVGYSELAPDAAAGGDSGT